MNIIEDYKCKYCQEMESAMHAFLICARAQITALERYYNIAKKVGIL